MPPVLTALYHRSLKEARAALHDDPSAAKFPFSDHRWEPPLCAAVRLECDVDIVELLLRHGADVTATDSNGRTPLECLNALPTTMDLSDGGADFARLLFGEEGMEACARDADIERQRRESVGSVLRSAEAGIM